MPETLDPGQQALDAEMAEIRRELGDDFVRLSRNATDSRLHAPDHSRTNTSPNKKDFINALRQLLVWSDMREESLFHPVVLIHLTREEIRGLEVEGVVLDGISETHPNGGVYIADLLKHFLGTDALSLEVCRAKFDTLKAIRATTVLRGVTGLVTRPPISKIPDNIEGLPRFPMRSLCAAVYKDGEWSETHVFPDGRWIVEGFDNTAFQYSQAAFEGLAVTDNESTGFPGIAADSTFAEPSATAETSIDVSIHNGDVRIFRPEENALRLIRSCRHFAMPPISVSQFVEAVRQAVLNNREFLPQNGKLYVRAFMVGLGGGTGAKRAKNYLFAVEVSPHGKYFGESTEQSETLPGISVKTITHDRPASGRYKVASNYAPIFRAKEQAKKEGYTDIMLVSSDGHVLENGTSNTFFVTCRSSDDFTLFTPSLAENILPGITRKSLIELLRDPNIQNMLGCKIEVVDHDYVKESDIGGFDGAFTTGTAAVIGNIGSIDFGTEGTRREPKKFNHPPTQAFIKKLYDLLMLARSGKLPGYESWAMEV